jgi:predicted DNA-binding transcriptional regulator AlpA
MQLLLASHREAAGGEGQQRLAAWLATEIAKCLNIQDLVCQPAEDRASTVRPTVREEKLTGKQVAEELGITPKTLANWRSRNEGPDCIRYGGRVLYLRSEVNRWKEDHWRSGSPRRQ